MLTAFNKSGRFYFLFLVVLLLTSCSKEENSLESGISKSLAEQRAKQLSNISYELYFDIPAEKTSPIESQISIHAELSNLRDPLILDFTADPSLINSVLVNDQQIEPIVENEHIIIGAQYLKKTTTVTIAFTAGDQSLNRKEDFLYTLFVPARASSCFPLFDQPDLKASYRLSLNIPDKWEAVTNTRLLEESSKKKKRLLKFDKTKPISSYLFAFAAGDFQKTTKNIDGHNLTMYHRESDTVKVQRNIESIYDWHFKSLEWLEQYTQIEYPFEKLDFVLIPSFQYGGMEHPGAIFYKSSSLMLSESATLKQQLSKAQLIAHEVSHMWFGDLVTMKWFDDVWLKEVFANFMADKIVSPNFDKINQDLNFFISHYPRAYEVDRTKGTHPIAQPLENLKNAGSLYGAIIYQKAPIVMRKLEQYVGPDSFKKSMQDYLAEYSYQNATWDDLLGIIKTNTDKNINQWNKLWVETAGRPSVRYVLKNNDNQEVEKFMTLSYSKDEYNTLWPQEINVSFYWEDSTASFSTTTGEQVDEVMGMKIPDWLYTNSDGMGYGYFYISAASRDSLLNHIMEYPELQRASLWVSLNEMLLEDDVPAELLLKALLKNLPTESNDLIAEYMIDMLKTIYWNLISDSNRAEMANQIEAVFLNMALGSTNNEIQGAYFNALQDIAITDGMLDILYRVWDHEMEIEGLELSESDYIRLSKNLALKHKKGNEIIDRQLQIIENEDARRKLNFIKPVFSNDKEVRDQYFYSLKQKEKRENEDWVLEALKYLHHPLRREHSQAYIQTGLELSEELQATGDIFFLKRWLDVTLGNYNDEKQADVVRQYLYKNHRLPIRIKNKVLQSADRLFRYAEITKDRKEKTVEVN